MPVSLSAHERPSGPFRQMRLVDDGKDLIVVPSPSDAVENPAFQPFKLPSLPRSQLDAAAVVCSMFARRHQRCLAALFFLDFATYGWSTGFPRQRCSADAACWRASREDFTRLPLSTRIAGSFQRRVLSAGEEPIDAVPPFDGVHLIFTWHSDQSDAWIFVRADGMSRPTTAPQVIRDEYEETLGAVLRRVELV